MFPYIKLAIDLDLILLYNVDFHLAVPKHEVNEIYEEDDEIPNPAIRPDHSKSWKTEYRYATYKDEE